ncbi:MAG TPA: galactokinase family protein [Gemmatimonadaceae bacterium]|nr:galactokinase family protein [Gemmatimonadaceae bacterium]
MNTVLFGKVGEALRRITRVGDDAVFRVWVPGRIEFLGKHTDYAGGRSMLCAAEHGICVAAAARPDSVLRVHDAVFGHVVECSLGDQALLGPPPSGFANYVHAVATRVARNFGLPLHGADIVIASDLPQAAGMSSSSALIVAIFLALAGVNDLESRAQYRRAINNCEQLAEYLGTIENGQSFGELEGERGVGTFGGSEDHTAILCARSGMLMQYGFCPVRLERTVPFPSDHVLVIATSGVAAEKTGAARDRYNRLSTMIREILEQWQSMTGEQYASLGAAINSSPDAPERMRRMLRTDAPARLARLDHFLLESNTLIPAAADAIARGELERLGTIVDQSQHAAEELLQNQIPETSFLAHSARELGAVAASAFGAGFGGSVWALVAEADADVFQNRWREAYASRFPQRRAEMLATKAGPGVSSAPS